MTDLPLCGHGTLIALWAGIAICAAIFAAMVYSIVSFCKSPDTTARMLSYRANVEVIWAIIPILIVIVTATPAVKPLIAVEQGCSSIATVASR